MSTPSDPGVVTRLPAGRRAVLYAVRRRGEATSEQVAEQLDITVSGARQHLSALARDGLVEATELPSPDRQARPAHPRVLGDAAPPTRTSPRPTASSPTSCSATSPTPTASCSTSSSPSGVRHRITNAQARLVTKRTLGAKVAELTRILDEDGYLASWEKVGPGVYRIVEHNCAIWAVAERYGQACTSELEFIRAVLDGADVERVQHMIAARVAARTRSGPAERIGPDSSNTTSTTMPGFGPRPVASWDG